MTSWYADCLIVGQEVYNGNRRDQNKRCSSEPDLRYFDLWGEGVPPPHQEDPQPAKCTVPRLRRNHEKDRPLQEISSPELTFQKQEGTTPPDPGA